MKATITSKGQVTIPVEIRRKLHLESGQVLEFDETAPCVKAIKVFDSKKMRAVIGCSKNAMPDLTTSQWLEQTRGLVELPPVKHGNRD